MIDLLASSSDASLLSLLWKLDRLRGFEVLLTGISRLTHATTEGLVRAK